MPRLSGRLRERHFHLYFLYWYFQPILCACHVQQRYPTASLALMDLLAPHAHLVLSWYLQHNAYLVQMFMEPTAWPVMSPGVFPVLSGTLMMALKVTLFEIQLITLASDVLQFTLNAWAVQPGLIVKLAHSDTLWTLDFVLVSLLSQQTLFWVQHDSRLSDLCRWSCLFSLQFWVRQGLVFQ